LVVYACDQLQPLLRPRYNAAIEGRVFVEGPDRQIIPDVWLRRTHSSEKGSSIALAEADAPVEVLVSALEIREAYINILDLRSGQRVVSVIEFVSPTNKYAGRGRDSYITKQQEVLNSDAHLVEIDLLRTGPHVLAVPERLARAERDYAYLACVNRARNGRELYQLYPCGLRERLFRIRIPLADGDPDVALNVQAVVEKAYEAGDYRSVIAYDRSCRPPLSAEDQGWANQLIQSARQAS
jgi:hypothetical protein